jgi:radical SAM superfamily enzyme YgiQ (UPF0313 family)
MKVFLVVPRALSPRQTYFEYPLGVGLIATALRRRGHEVAIYDQNAEGADEDLLFGRLRQFRPEVAGFSVITPSYPVARRHIGRLRSECPGVRVVAGGVHANLFPEDLLADGVDVVVLGQGQHVMPALVDCLDDNESWRNLPGLVFRDRRGDLVRTACDAGSPLVEDVDMVDRDVYNLPLYSHHSMFASLGCPFHCMFCCNYSGTVLHASGTASQGGVSVRPTGRRPRTSMSIPRRSVRSR